MIPVREVYPAPLDKTEVGELKAGPAYGDFNKGRHGTFIRMPAKFVSPLHYHTADYFGIKDSTSWCQQLGLDSN